MKRPILIIIIAIISFFIGWFANEAYTFSQAMKEDVFHPYRADTGRNLIGTWIVRALQVPECKLCDSANFTLNKLIAQEVHVNDTLSFKSDSASYCSIDKKTFAYLFKIVKNKIVLYESDWVYDIDISSLRGDTLSLSIGQHYVSNVGDTAGPKNLLVNLIRLK